MIKISFIIPVYNTEKYLRQCIDSILEQNMQEMEIICIDDGSVDDSVSILSQYEKKDSRIKLFRQEHKGVSCARNLGIREAKGNYLMFVDSDDYLLPRSLKQVYEIAEKKQADILAFSGKTEKFCYLLPWIIDCFSTRNKEYFSFEGKLFLKEHGAQPVIWNKLFRRELLVKNDISFCEELSIGEDQLFDFLVFPVAKKICFSRRKLYCYRVGRMGSAMQQAERTLKKAEDHLKVVQKIWDNWSQKKICESGYEWLWQYFIQFLYTTIVQLESPQFYATEVLQYIEEYKPKKIKLSKETQYYMEEIRQMSLGIEKRKKIIVKEICLLCRKMIRCLKEYGVFNMGKKMILKIYNKVH